MSTKKASATSSSASNSNDNVIGGKYQLLLQGSQGPRISSGKSAVLDAVRMTTTGKADGGKEAWRNKTGLTLRPMMCLNLGPFMYRETKGEAEQEPRGVEA